MRQPASSAMDSASLGFPPITFGSVLQPFSEHVNVERTETSIGMSVLRGRTVKHAHSSPAVAYQQRRNATGARLAGNVSGRPTRQKYLGVTFFSVDEKHFVRGWTMHG
jgi:hypothetical protein